MIEKNLMTKPKDQHIAGAKTKVKVKPKLKAYQSLTALRKEYNIRKMADAFASNLKRMPKDELMRRVSPQNSTKLEVEALERALGHPSGYEISPWLENPGPKGFKLLPIPREKEKRLREKRRLDNAVI